MFYFNHVLIVLIMLISSQANAMWKLAQRIPKDNKLPQQKERSWDEQLLEAQDLEGFLAEAARREVNPNHSITNSQKTAFLLACKRDMSGEKVRTLLAHGEIRISRVFEEDIWPCLSGAIEVGNWKAVDLILGCENLSLSKTEIEFSIERIFAQR
jgi:hypothetical protein